jgi:hypothetical protein
MYSIAVEDQDIIIRLNSGLIDQDALAKLLDYLELESIRKRSRLTQEQASTLANEIDRKIWENTKQTYTEK